MAVVNTTTASIAAEAARKVASSGKPTVCFVGQIESVSGDSIGSTYRLISVPGDFILTSLEIASDALGGSCAADIGVYQMAGNGGAVVDADEFASAVSLVSAVAWTAVMEEAAAADIDKIGKPLWERLGVTANPGIGYDIVATLTGASAAAGTVAIRARGYYA